MWKIIMTMAAFICFSPVSILKWFLRWLLSKIVLSHWQHLYILLVTVYSKMALKVTSFRKIFVILFALICFLPSMASNMGYKLNSMWEGIVTLVSLIWPIPTVSSQVTFKISEWYQKKLCHNGYIYIDSSHCGFSYDVEDYCLLINLCDISYIDMVHPQYGFSYGILVE